MIRHVPLSAIVGIVSALALIGGPARADLGLSVEPARFEIEAAAGETKTMPLAILNSSSSSVHVVASTNDFVIDAKGDYAFLAPGSSRYSASRWMSINPREFDVGPGTTSEVRFTVTVPHGVSGEYRSLVFFATRPPRKPGGFGISEKVASRMYVIVRDTAKADGNVARVVARQLASSNAYDVTFKNSGDMHVYVNGYVEIKAGSSVVDRLKLPVDTVVERDGTRTISAIGKSLPAGAYSATAVLDFGGNSRVGGQTTFVVH